MKRKAVFAGSFDPVTKGHIDIIKKALGIFDEVHVVIAINPDKKYMFDAEKRLEMLRAAISGIQCGKNRVTAAYWEKYTYEYCNMIGASHIVKGVRNASDFEYEKDLAKQTNALCDGIETVMLMPSEECETISSTDARKALLNGDYPENILPVEVISILKAKQQSESESKVTEK